MRRKSGLHIFSLLAIVAAILAGCGVSSIPQASTNSTPTIRWRTQPGSLDDQAAYQSIAESTSQMLTNQNIRVAYEPDMSQDYTAKLKAELVSGNAPDIFWIGGVELADIVATGQVLDLKPLIDADPSFTLDDFYRQPIEELSHDGKVYGLPRDISTLVVYYNADLFTAAGLATPNELAAQGKWNWSAPLNSARQLPEPAKGQHGAGWNNWWGPSWSYFVQAAGGSLFNAERTACALDSPETIEAARFAQTFYTEKLRPTGGQETLDNLFNAGRIGMLWSGRWMTPTVRKNARFTWDVAEMPIGKRQSSWLFWGAYLINARTENPQAAWQVLKQLTSAESMGKLATLGSTIPARKNSASIDLFLASSPPRNNQAFLNSLAYATVEAPLWHISWSDYNNRVQSLWDQLIAGEITPEQFAEQACE